MTGVTLTPSSDFDTFHKVSSGILRFWCPSIQKGTIFEPESHQRPVTKGAKLVFQNAYVVFESEKKRRRSVTKGVKLDFKMYTMQYVLRQITPEVQGTLR